MEPRQARISVKSECSQHPALSHTTVDQTVDGPARDHCPHARAKTARFMERPPGFLPRSDT